jgi:hypothetical protein
MMVMLDAKGVLSVGATIVSSLVHITTRKTIAARSQPQLTLLPQRHLHHHLKVKDAPGVTTLEEDVVLLKTHVEKVRETVMVL